VFTGIVEELGRVKSVKPSSLEVSCRKVIEGTKIGDSISVNGVCLTVSSMGSGTLKFDVSEETLRRTSLKLLKSGDYVNLERAMRADGRFGGHIVQGHVDTTTKVEGVRREKSGFTFTFKLPESYRKYVVEKGSIAVDGISLTVSRLFPDSFCVAVIPHTYENTNLKFKRAGSIVNLEFDIVAKYVERLCRTG